MQDSNEISLIYKEGKRKRIEAMRLTEFPFFYNSIIFNMLMPELSERRQAY